MDRLGGTCVMASEIDPDCQHVYRANFSTGSGETKLFGAIEQLTADQVSLEQVPAHDVLCAGFPCQPFSKSGSQMGTRDRIRGTLFFHIMEIVRYRHPRFIVLENVRNLAGPRHRDTWETIIKSLRDEGYAVASRPAVFSPHMLPPELDGRPQVRERVFILARFLGPTANSLADLAPLVESRPVGDWSPERWSIYDYLDDESTIDQARYGLRDDELIWLSAWQDFVRSIEGPLPGFPIWLEEFDGREPIDTSLPEWKQSFIQKNRSFYFVNRHQVDAWRKRHPEVEGFPASRKKFEWQGGRDHDRDFRKLVIHFRPSGVRVKPPTYVPALVAINQTSIIGRFNRRITPREAARLQGFPDSFELHETPSVAYRQLGNAVNIGAVTYVAQRLFQDELIGAPMRLLEGVA